VNRTTPRTQSALLECMQEHNVTLDGKTFPLPAPFMVVATQNPIEHQGTYPLPEAQIDRFLLKISMGYLSAEEEMSVVAAQKAQHPIETLRPVATLADILALQEEVKKITVSAQVMQYIVNLVYSTRNKEDIKLGASPRASIALMKASSAWALLESRDYVVPEDVAQLLPFVLKHRINVHPKALVSGKTADSIVREILSVVPIP